MGSGPKRVVGFVCLMLTKHLWHVGVWETFCPCLGEFLEVRFQWLDTETVESRACEETLVGPQCSEEVHVLVEKPILDRGASTHVRLCSTLSWEQCPFQNGISALGLWLTGRETDKPNGRAESLPSKTSARKWPHPPSYVSEVKMHWPEFHKRQRGLHWAGAK